MSALINGNISTQTLGGAAKWVLVVGALIGSWIAQDRRITNVEATLKQEMIGYQIIFNSLNNRMDRMENIINKRLDRIEDKLP